MTTTHLKSLLFVPGDSEKKMLKGISTQASALILDLEDSVASQNLDKARDLVCEFLASRVNRAQQLWVRINSLASPHALQDLAGVVAGKPDGIVVPKTESVRDVNVLCNYLTALEVREGLQPGCVRIIPVSTETPASLFELSSYKESSKRLAGITWGAEDLATALGAATNRTALGDYDFTYRLARSLSLAAAYSAGVQAIDTISPDFRDIDALTKEVTSARRAGFTGKLAIHPEQIAVINAGFLPSAEELDHARAIVRAFQSMDNAGVVQLEGRMLDRPHLDQALRILSQSEL